MHSDEPPVPPQPILLVTGMSGAGKTTALRTLEDLGWEAIDNFPVRLLGRLIGKDHPGRTPLAIGFDSRTRGFDPKDIVELVDRMSQREDLAVHTLFLDCASGELERRYNENRRRHPMAQGRPVLDGIKAERELLEPLRSWAEAVVDTTDYSTNQLQQVMRDRYHDSAPVEMVITVSSFGFARGMPPLADLVFDMRFLANPHWDAALREQTGLDAEVGDYIEADEAFVPAYERIRDLLLFLIPQYRDEGRSYLNVAFGCTGGRHRSVFTAERIAQALRDAGFSPTVRHRNLTTRAADELEKPRRQANG
ncbi:RNase adapter RapZ [Qipengyuania oceanensis]|uniref:RNase adapter RapZ n=1 Tax=Qipengyuania oceanensis TaxID=1463597 RepID=A0A844YEE9_9SPHN|nr:RNase adapter RapZ [Qipengyuania oceanensis]MXO63476.1 RNase adapter RapZ [Qipengyuania oceanensis]